MLGAILEVCFFAVGASVFLWLGSSYLLESSERDAWRKAEELKISVQGMSFHLQRGATGEWTGQNQDGLVPSAALLSSVQQLFQNEEAVSSIVPDGAVPIEGIREIEFQSEGVFLERWKIGEKNSLLQQHYVQREPLGTLELRADPLFALLDRPNVSLVRSEVFSFTPEAVERFVVESQGQTELHFVRNDGSWEVNGETADDPFVESLLRTVLALQIDLDRFKASQSEDFLTESGETSPRLSLYLRGNDALHRRQLEYLTVSSSSSSEGQEQTPFLASGSLLPGVWPVQESSLFTARFDQDAFLPAEVFVSDPLDRDRSEMAPAQVEPAQKKPAQKKTVP